MNLQPLIETQKILDARIVEQHGLEGQDLLPEKILALQVELGELANEWRGFKFWSEDREPSGEMECGHCTNGYRHKNLGDGEVWIEPCKKCDGRGTHNPMLEEYVDCLHFILSVGIDLGFDNQTFIPHEGMYENVKDLGVQKLLTGLMSTSHELLLSKKVSIYSQVVIGFVVMGELLGFSTEQIEAAYYAKNKTNHARQATGY